MFSFFLSSLMAIFASLHFITLLFWLCMCFVMFSWDDYTGNYFAALRDFFPFFAHVFPFTFLLRKGREPLSPLLNHSCTDASIAMQLPQIAFSLYLFPVSSVLSCASLDMLYCLMSHKYSVIVLLSPYSGRIRTKQSVIMCVRERTSSIQGTSCIWALHSCTEWPDLEDVSHLGQLEMQK